MLKLEVNNSYCRILGISPEQMQELKTLFSYKDTKAFFYGFGEHVVKYLISKDGVFPTGLLYKLDRWVVKNNCTVVENRRKPVSNVKFNLDLGVTPYPEQLEAVEACLERFRGTVAAVTGFGKSITMALLVAKLGLRTLIVVPNLSLKTQLRESFIKYFGSLDNITIENIDSPSLDIKGEYDCLIIDEAHHVAAKTYRKLNKDAWDNIYHRFFFTATPYRSDFEEQLLYESVAGQVIYEVAYKDAVKNGYVVPVEAYYVDLPKEQTAAYTWPEVYADLVTKNEHRNSLIAKLLLKLESSGLPTLCLVKEIAHGNSILKHILRVINDDRVAFVKGENDDNKHTIDLFNNTVTKLLIGTVGVLGEGVDTRPTEFIVIAGLGKAKGQFMQQVGRGLRKHAGKASCKVIIFKDSSHKWTLTHFKAQVKILKEEYGVICQKLEL